MEALWRLGVCGYVAGKAIGGAVIMAVRIRVTVMLIIVGNAEVACIMCHIYCRSFTSELVTEYSPRAWEAGLMIILIWMRNLVP